MSKKRAIGSIIFIFSFLVLLQATPIHHYLILKATEYACQSQFNASLEYDSVKREGNTLILSNVQLTKPRYSIDAKELQIDYQLIWPRIKFQSVNAKLHLSDREIPLDAHGTIGASQIIEFSADFGDRGLDLKEFAGSRLLPDMEIQEGILFGSLCFRYSSNGHLNTSGAAKLQDVAALYLPMNTQFRVKEATILCCDTNDLAKVEFSQLAFSSSDEYSTLFLDQVFTKNPLSDSYNGSFSIEHHESELLCRGCLELPQDQVLFGISKTHGITFAIADFDLSNLPTIPALKTSGSLTVEGNYNSGHWNYHLALSDFLLENHRFRVTVPELKHTSADQAVEIFNGGYLEKHTGVAFTDTHCLLEYSDSILSAKQIETFANSIFFAGNIHVDYREKKQGRLIIDVDNHTINGKLSQLKTLLNSIDFPIFVNDIPIDGLIGYGGGGAHGRFVFSQSPEGIRSESSIELEGTLTGGECKNIINNVTLHDIHLNFAYHHGNRSLVLNDIQGAVLVGKPSKEEEFTLNSDCIRFDDVTNNKGSFDFWIGDRHRDLVRAAGTFNGLDQNNIELNFNKELTHFGTTHPEIHQCVLDRWTRVSEFSMDAEIALQESIGDLQKITKTGLIPFSQGLVGEFNRIKTAVGSARFHCDYSQGTKRFQFFADGQNLGLGSFPISQFKCAGRHQSQKWSVDQFQLDDLNISLDFRKSDEGLKIEFFGLQLGSIALLGSEGLYIPQDDHLEIRLHLAEFDLSKAKDLPTLSSFVNTYNPSGLLKTKGVFTFDLLKGSQSWLAKLDLAPCQQVFSLGGISFETHQGIHLQWQPRSGLSLKNFETHLLREHEDMAAKVVIVDAGYDFFHTGLWCKEAHMVIHPNHAHWAAEKLHTFFPKIISEDLLNGAKQLSFNTPLEVMLSFRGKEMLWSLNDFTTLYKGKPYTLYGLSLASQPGLVNILFDYGLWGRKIPVTLTSPTFSLKSGTLSFHDEEKDTSIDFEWTRQKSTEIDFQSVHGKYEGLFVNLAGQNNTLKGVVEGDLDKLLVLAAENSIGGVLNQCSLGKGFSLNGTWKIDRNQWQNTQFSGSVHGNQCAIMGYLIDQLDFEVATSPYSIQLKHIQANDPSGTLSIENATLTKNTDESWSLQAPYIKADNVRPRHLRSSHSAHPPFKRPLVVKQLELFDLNGNIEDRKSFRGNGKLLFTNAYEGFSDIALPADLFKRLGSEVPSLIPVTGSIHYEISDEKIFVTKLKDVYTDKKLVKFYKPKSSVSYVGFDGTLHLKVGLQPYNLLLKLKDLVTVSIDGTIDSPKYAIQRDQEDS